jgi:hypothetical protein
LAFLLEVSQKLKIEGIFDIQLNFLEVSKESLFTQMIRNLILLGLFLWAVFGQTRPQGRLISTQIGPNQSQNLTVTSWDAIKGVGYDSSSVPIPDGGNTPRLSSSSVSTLSGDGVIYFVTQVNIPILFSYQSGCSTMDRTLSFWISISR